MATFTHRLAVSDVRETAHPGQHFRELVRPLPCDCKRTNSARTDPGNGPSGSIVPKLPLLLGFWQNFFQQESGILVRKRIIFKTSVRFPTIQFTRLDKNPNRDRHLFGSNQVIEYSRDKVLIALTILKHHHTGRFFGIILSRHIHPPFTTRIFKDL